MMAQNRSTAVMQRRIEPHDSLDDFPTPLWATRALLEHVLKFELNDSVWEPACNRGFMARPLFEYFDKVWATDIHDYGYEEMLDQHDFLMPFVTQQIKPDWIITNPPFRLADQFVLRAREVASKGCAFIVRSAFLEGITRYNELFSKTPPSIIAQFCERVPMVKARIDPQVSSATAYSWLIWEWSSNQTKFVWIPPCRKQLEREGDYDGKN